MPTDPPTLDTTSTYALIATLVGFVIWIARKASPATWAKIPTRWRWIVPITLAGLAAFAEAYQFGRPWHHALLLGLGAGLAAAGGHHALLDSPLPYGNAVLLLIGLALSPMLVGCTGSLEQARYVGSHERSARGAPARSTQRCVELDDRRQFAGMVAKGAAVLAGAAGLSTIPVEDDDKALRYGLAGGAVVAGAVAAGAMVVAEGAGEAWARECSL